MISSQELNKISRERIKDAKILARNKAYDGALYISGYSIELALKAIVCKNLCLSGIPHTSDEFRRIADLKTHNLEALLKQTPNNVQTKIKSTYLGEWSTVLKWNPELRYAPIRGRLMKQEAEGAILSSEKILKFLWKHA
jgi:HEPN domain-containing protein